jgi:hypothetical protein
MYKQQCAGKQKEKNGISHPRRPHHHRQLQPWVPQLATPERKHRSLTESLSVSKEDKSSAVNSRTNSLSEPSAPGSPAADWLSTPASETALSWWSWSEPMCHSRTKQATETSSSARSAKSDKGKRGESISRSEKPLSCQTQLRAVKVVWKKGFRRTEEDRLASLMTSSFPIFCLQWSG